MCYMILSGGLGHEMKSSFADEINKVYISIILLIGAKIILFQGLIDFWIPSFWNISDCTRPECVILDSNH